MKPSDKFESLKSDNAYGRIQYCRFMLLMHDFLSDAENEKVKRRIQKWLDKHGCEVRTRGVKSND